MHTREPEVFAAANWFMVWAMLEFCEARLFPESDVLLLPGVALLPLAVEVLLPLVVPVPDEPVVTPVLDEPDPEPVLVPDAVVLSDDVLPVVPLPLSVLSVVPELLVSLLSD